MPCKTFVLSVFIDLRSAERVCSYYGSGSQTVVRVPLVVREDLQGGMRRGLLCVFLHKKYIHRCSFYLSGSVNKFLKFCVAYFPYCFLKMAIKSSHSHFVHVAYVSILVFQTFDRMIFGTLTFPGTRWYVMTVRDTQMVRDRKKFENHCTMDFVSAHKQINI